MFEPKSLSREGIDRALERAERYRLLSEPWEAESICLDVLALEPRHQGALVTRLLAITDQFRTEGAERVEDARALLDHLDGAYERHYYAGIIWERRATALARQRGPGWGQVAYDRLREAMRCYEEAEALRPAGDDSSIIRWNSCARMIMRHEEVRPEPEVTFRPLLE